MFKTDTDHVLSLPQMLNEMDIALAAEIKAQESGEKSHKATKGKLVGEQPGLYLYSFSLEEPWEADDDTPISIEAGNGQSINGTVVASNGITITISSDKLLSHDALQKIRLIDGFTQSLKQLREVLKSIPEHNAKNGRVVRFGASQHADLQKPEFAEISLSAIAKQQEGQLHAQKEQLQQRLKVIEDQLTHLNQKYELTVTNAQGALEKLSLRYSIYNNNLASLVNYQQSFSVLEKELIHLIQQRTSLQNTCTHLYIRGASKNDD